MNFSDVKKVLNFFFSRVILFDFFFWRKGAFRVFAEIRISVKIRR